VHRSRLTAIIIDAPPETVDATARFWSAAFGTEPPAGPADPYAGVGRPRGIDVAVQRVGEDDGPRVHLDIETDDVEAEVRRLEGHGAERLSQIHGWRVMRDPGGNVFCVVPPQTDDFPAETREWPDGPDPEHAR
jgi:hypothetical protein